MKQYTNAIMIAVVTLSSTAMNAQNLMTFSLNTGEVIEGYISSQTPGKEINIKGKNANGIDVERLNLTWSNVMAINLKARQPEDLSGTDRQYTLASGEIVSGQYIREIPGKSITIKQDNGTERFFWIKDVKRMLVKPYNTEQTLPEQYWLQDIVVTKEGKEYTGYIIEQNLTSKNSSDYYITLVDNQAREQQIKLVDILQYRKQENSTVRQFLVDKIMEEGQCEINDQVVNFFKMEERDDDMLLVPDTITSEMIYVSDKPTEITFQANFKKEEDGHSYLMVPILKFNVKIAKRMVEREGCSNKTIWREGIEPYEQKQSRNHTATIKFRNLRTGNYILLDKTACQAVQIVIKK